MVDKENIMKGTTTVGIRCEDGVILAADKRVTTGHLIAGQLQKIFEITDNMAITTAGGVSDNQLLTKLIKAELKLKEVRTNKKTSVKEAANLLSQLVYNNIRKMSMIPGITHLLLGGSDSTGNHLYEVYPDGSLNEYEKFVASGSGSTMVYGVLETLYKEDMSGDECVDLALKALSAALKRDSASGDGFVVVKITPEGIERVADKDLEIKLEK
ncbi:MAG: proteasome subunit beta [Nanoarchaeota archaeon]